MRSTKIPAENIYGCPCFVSLPHFIYCSPFELIHKTNKLRDMLIIINILMFSFFRHRITKTNGHRKNKPPPKHHLSEKVDQKESEKKNKMKWTEERANGRRHGRTKDARAQCSPRRSIMRTQYIVCTIFIVLFMLLYIHHTIIFHRMISRFRCFCRCSRCCRRDHNCREEEKESPACRRRNGIFILFHILCIFAHTLVRFLGGGSSGGGGDGGADGVASSENGNHLHGWMKWVEKNNFMFAFEHTEKQPKNAHISWNRNKWKCKQMNNGSASAHTTQRISILHSNWFFRIIIISMNELNRSQISTDNSCRQPCDPTIGNRIKLRF